MSFNETDITNGVSISGSTSPFNTYIKTENPGVYNIQFSAQVEKTDSGTDVITIWLRKNGIDLTDSATKLTLSGNGTKVVAAWNWFVSSAANDYYQIIWVSADTNMRLYAEPINDTPGIPSVILTVNRVDQFLSNTGSFSGSFTGILTGTASYASQALSASFATTASYVANASSFPFTGSAIITGSLSVTGPSVVTGSFTVITGSAVELQVLNTGVKIGNVITDVHTVTGSLITSGSIRISNLNSGSVLFIGSGNEITQDNSNFYWNDITNRLSIGTSTTTASLYLKGPSNTASDTIFRAENSSSTGRVIIDGNGNTTVAAIQNTSTTYFSAGDTTIGPVISVTCDASVRNKFLNIHHNQSNTIIGKIGSGDNILYLGITGIIPSNTNQARSNILFTAQGYDNGGSFFEFASTTNALYSTPSGGNPSMLKIKGSIGGNAAGIFSWADFVGTINQTGGTSPTIGLHYRPTVTAITGSHYGLLVRPATFNGVNMGSTRYPSSSFHIVSNSTSSVLLVENQSSSSIFDIQNNGSGSYNGNLTITGSLTVAPASAVELQVTSTGVKIGNVSTDTHTVTGSLNITGSLVLNGSDLSTAWTSYTPTWTTDGATQPVLNNGTLTGAYKQIGKTVFVRVKLNPGSSTTFGTGAFQFSLPFSASSADGVQFPCSILNDGFAWYQATVNGTYSGVTNKTAIIAQSAGGANSSEAVTATHPFTFGSADSIQFNGSYESI